MKIEFNLIVNYFNEVLLPNFTQLLITPWVIRDALWLVLPLILILIFIHVYFGRNRIEELGWNSAFANAVSLLWVCAQLFKFLFLNYSFKSFFDNSLFRQHFIFIIILLIWVFVILRFNFYHSVPKRFAYFISSADAVYIIAYLAIAIVVGDILITWHILLASALVFVVLVALFALLKDTIPMSSVAKRVTTERIHKKMRHKRAVKAARTRKFNNLFYNLKSKFINWKEGLFNLFGY